MDTSEQADVSAHCYLQCSLIKQHSPFLSRSAIKDNQLDSVISGNPQLSQIEFQESLIFHIYSRMIYVSIQLQRMHKPYKDNRYSRRDQKQSSNDNSNLYKKQGSSSSSFIPSVNKDLSSKIQKASLCNNFLSLSPLLL